MFGDIYDARTNSFPKMRVFKKDLTKSQITVESIPSSDFKFSSGTLQSEKINAWEIGGELKLGILCEKVDLIGPAKFMKNKSSGRNIVEYSYILKTKTKEESINWRSDELKKYYNFKGIENYGTHMVVGIQYGGNAVVTLSYEMEKNEDFQEIQDQLKGQFSAFPHVTGDVIIKKTTRKIINTSKMTVTYLADVTGDSPTTIEEAKIFMQTMGTRLTEYNDGKGVKIAYELVPLQVVSKFLDIPIEGNKPYSALSEQDVLGISQILEKMEIQKEKFNKCVQNLDENKDFFTKFDQQKLETTKKEVTVKFIDVRSDINEMVMLFHNNNLSIKDSCDTLTKNVDELDTIIEAAIKDFNPMNIKVDFIKESNTRHVKYIYDEREYAKYKLKDKILNIGLYSIQSPFFKLFKMFIYECDSHYENNILNKLKKVFRAHRIYILVDTDILQSFFTNELKSALVNVSTKILEHFPEYPLYKYETEKGYELYISILDLNVNELTADIREKMLGAFDRFQISIYEKKHFTKLQQLEN
uniref:MACPF domain-containing protein n=1 Tax=Panagrolaimus sp. ES5 TaxID=591445 RepID=A0AC34FK88_9BILA